MGEEAVLGGTRERAVYVRDALGNVTRIQQERRRQTTDTYYTLDSRGNVLEEECEGVVKAYEYDYTGAPVSQTISVDGGATEQRTTYGYDEMNRLAEVWTDGGLEASYTYDGCGRLLTTTYGNGVVEETQYNQAGLPTSVVNEAADGTVLSQHAYTYDYDGNQRTKTEGADVTEYEYDGRGQLVETTLPDGTVQRYGFDANGNRTSLEEETEAGVETTEYEYDGNDRLTSESTNGSETTYAYDDAGNLLRKENDNLTVEMDYDLAGRLTAWTDGGRRRSTPITPTERGGGRPSTAWRRGTSGPGTRLRLTWWTAKW